MIGKEISHYRILEKLGEGGMGVVYKAEDKNLKRTVALKFLPPQLTRDPQAKQRFVREARAASTLDHANICTIYEIDEAEEQTFMAMACIEGQTLKEKIESEPMELDEVTGLAIQVAEGLREAHEKGIVHRDIKSENIMVTPRGQAKIMDFGLARLTGETRLTKTGMTMGTVAYMSPEQGRGEEIDHKSDIWSLGVVMYEMLAGRLPFCADYEAAVVYAILNEDPKPVTELRPDVPIELEHIIVRATEKNPDERYQNAGELLADLTALSRDEEVAAAKPRPKAAKPIGKSIAVLPFASLSDSKEDEYFSDGTTEDIITQLSKIGELKVISRTSVMKYKNSDKTVREIGRELSVATVLEGSVRRAGDRVRIVSQLVDARTDEHLWAETYDREMKDIFAIQSDVAQKIATALKAKLSSSVIMRLERKPTENLEAYDYYLKGREYYYRYRKQDNENAIELFKKALELDPDYALAYAGLGDAYGQRTGRFGLEAKWADAALEASEKAIEIDPACSEAYKAMGLANMVKGKRHDALKAYHKAVELNPNDFLTIGNIGTTNFALGEYGEALKWSKKGVTLSPTFAFAYSNVGYVYMSLDDYDEAEQWFSKALELQPDLIYAHREFITMYIVKGDHEKARAHSRKALSIAPDEVDSLLWAGDTELSARDYSEAEKYYRKALELYSTGSPGATGICVITSLAYVFCKTERQEEAERLFTQGLELARKLIEEGDESRQLPYYVAAIHAIHGNKDEAHLWLQKAIDAGWRDYRISMRDPLMENLRDDEQYKLMMAGVKGMIDQMRRRAQKDNGE
jgi:serine/threonine protein kinase/Tfp pilus assembly protein PilF